MTITLTQDQADELELYVERLEEAASDAALLLAREDVG